MRVMTVMATFAFMIPLAASALSAPVTSIALAPISSEALHQCAVGDLKKALRSRLGRSRLFRLVPPPEDTASVTLEIVECSRLEQRKQTFTSKGGPVTGPVGRGAGTGAESDVGVQTETVRSVILRARLASGSRFVGVAASPRDRTLLEAADTLRGAIDKALTERGPWLLPGP
jgi:hypothetical protein